MLGLAEPVLAIHQHRAGEAELSDARRDLGVGERLRSLVGIRDERIDRQDPVRVKLAPWYSTVWHQTPKTRKARHGEPGGPDYGRNLGGRG